MTIFFQDIALQFPEFAVSFKFFCHILCNGDVHNRASGRARRKEERGKFDEVGTFPQKNLSGTLKVRVGAGK